MLRSLRVSCAVTAIVLSILGPGALAAAGDDGPGHSFPPDRPTRTILRPSEIASPAPRPSDKEVILLVLTFCVLPALLLVFLGPPLLSLIG